MLDASVVIKWFHSENERDLSAALDLYDEYERGDLVVAASNVLPLELLNFAARRLRFSEEKLLSYAREVDRLHLVLVQPSMTIIARWAARGLSAYDASYVALAEERGTRIVTADRQILAVAPELAMSLPDALAGA